MAIQRFILILIVIFASWCGDAPKRAVADHTLLFVDDHEVLYRAGTKLIITPARRHPTPVISEDKPWEVAIGWMSCYRDPQSGKYQIWYQAYSGKVADSKKMACVVCYAESRDGRTFTKPEFDLFPFNDVRRTNIVLIGNGGYGDRYGASVIVEPNDPDPTRRYKMAYYDWSVVEGQKEAAGLHLAYSPDGIHWTKLERAPLLMTAYGGRNQQPPRQGESPYAETPYKGSIRKTWAIPFSMSDAMDLMFDDQRSKYVIYGKLWLQGPDGGLAWKHALGRTESADLIQWSPPELVCVPDDNDPPDMEFHTVPVFRHEGVYFGLNQNLNRRGGGTIDIELMTSRDGANWNRPFRRQQFIEHGTDRDFDGGSIFTNATPVVLDDEIRFYYGAYGRGAVGGGEQIEGKQQLSGVGLATIRRDRFAGITTEPVSRQTTLKKELHHIGQITLKPRSLAHTRAIELNVNASDGSVRVELLDEQGYRVPGFTRDDCKPLRGDLLRGQVQWLGSELKDVSSGKYSLRIHLERATLHAIYLVADPN